MRLRLNLCVLLFIAPQWLFAQNPVAGDASEDGLFVWLKATDGLNADENLKKFLQDNPELANYKWKRTFITNTEPLNRIYTVKGFSNANVRDQFAILIQRMTGVDMVESIPDYRFFHTPNDLQTKQWNLNKIQAESAWDISKGGKNILVGLVDDGMDTAHSDLQPALWHNPKEIPGNGKDDDGNGYADDCYGWDMADNDNNPGVVVSDNLSHGTHCAGIIGAASNNSNGIASIGYNVKILAVKCGKNGQPYIYNGYEGVEYCINNGTRIVSMSWGGGGYSATYQAIFDYAYKKGVICVAAAGNSSTNAVMYPAGYNHVIAVGSTTNTDAKSGFSNYGSWVDVMAPGSAIYSTLPGNTYGNYSGTSMACPLVSGLCALMLSKNPSASATQIEACLKSGCENIDGMNPSYINQMGSGRINALQSMRCLASVLAGFQPSKWRVCTGDTIQFTDRSTTNVTQWKWTFSGGTPNSSALQHPVVRYNTPGKYKVKLWVTDGKDADSVEIEFAISAGVPTLAFSGKQSIYSGDYGTIEAILSGTGPWDITYTDGTNVFTNKGIQYSPYFILVSPKKNTIYKPLTVSESACNGTVSDSAVFTVLPPPAGGSGSCDSGYLFQMALSDGSRAMRALDLEVANDSTVLLAGYNGSGSGQDGFLASVNTNGKINWAKRSGGSSEDGFYCVDIDESGSVYTGGYTYSATSGRSAVMAKYKPDGSLAWRKIYGFGSEYIYRVNVSADRKYVYFTGLSLDQSYGSEDFTIYKLDTNGNVQWVKQVGDGELNRNHQMLETNNGNDLYVIGNFGDAFPVLHGCLLKLDANGSIVWNKKYQLPTNYQVSFHDIKSWGNDLIVYGYLGLNSGGNTSVTRETMLARLASDGTVKWAKKYSLSTTNPWQMQIIDKQILLSGGNSNNGEDGFILLTDSNGNVLLAKNLGTTASEYIFGLRTTNNKEIYFAGYQNPGTSRAWFGKTGCRLNALCNATDATPGVQNITLNSGNLSWNVKDFNRPVTFNLTETSFTPSLTVICKSNKIQKPPCDGKPAFKITDNCWGKPVGFTYAGTIEKYIPESWSWDFGDGGSASGNPVEHRFTKQGTYRVVMKVLSRLGNFTCIDSSVQFYRAVDSFRILSMPPDTTICAGDSIQLSAIQFLCENPLLKYKWTPVWINHATAARPWVSPKMTQFYSVEVTDGLGRKATGFMKITVNPNCCKSKARWAVNAPFCEGDTIYFRNISTAKSNAVFAWKFPGTNLPVYNGKNPTGVVFPKSGVYKVSLSLLDQCSSDAIDSNIFIFPKPKAYAGHDTLFCRADSLQLGEDPVGRNQYRWSPTAGLNSTVIANPVARITAPVVYHLKVSDENGCSNLDTVVIGFGTPPEAYLGPDTTLCTGESTWIGTAPVPGTSYLWNQGAATSSVWVSTAGTYICTARNICGEKKDTIVVKFDNCMCPVYIPNAFTPGRSSGLNDRLNIVFTCPYSSANLRIYNRWGQKVFETADLNVLWDGNYLGKRVPDGAYYCVLSVKGKYKGRVQEVIKNGIVYVLD
ncbi:MAG: S8 family serine peptidase [Bacteroidetes bacterium]|nr:S8 family serine peptidase [Bacteroidota bacterium]